VADSQKGVTQYLVLDDKKQKCFTILLLELDLNGFFGMI